MSKGRVIVYVAKKCNIIGGKPSKAQRDREIGGKFDFGDSPILEEGLLGQINLPSGSPRLIFYMPNCFGFGYFYTFGPDCFFTLMNFIIFTASTSLLRMDHWFAIYVTCNVFDFDGPNVGAWI